MRSMILPAIIALLAASPSTGAENTATDNTAIKIYGKAIISADYIDGGAGDYTGITSSESRLGFKGSIALTEEIRAIWQIETKINFDISGTEFASRNSFLGFTGRFGTLKLGRHDTPFKMISKEIDAFLNRIGDSRNIVGKDFRGFDIRANSMLLYESPQALKTRFRFLYKTEEEQDGSDLISGSVGYEVHGLKLWAAGEAHGKMMTAVGDTAASEKSEYGLRISGSWSMEPFTLYGMIERLRNLDGIDGVSKDSWVLGLGWAMDESWSLQLKYAGTGGRSDVDSAAGDMFSAAVDLQANESALLFLAAAVTLNEENCRYSMISPGLTTRLEREYGEDPWGISLGTIISF